MAKSTIYKKVWTPPSKTHIQVWLIWAVTIDWNINSIQKHPLRTDIQGLVGHFNSGHQTGAKTHTQAGDVTGQVEGAASAALAAPASSTTAGAIQLMM